MNHTLEKSFMVTPRRMPGPGTGLQWGLGTASLQGSRCGRAGTFPGAAGDSGQGARGPGGGGKRRKRQGGRPGGEAAQRGQGARKQETEDHLGTE